MTMTMTTVPTTTTDASSRESATTTATTTLLKKAQAMIELEQSLTATMEKVEPWLPSQNNTATAGTGSNASSRPRVRSLPTSMEQVDVILAVARNWAARTSAPDGWNPAAPVMGFTTPNPMPHQLRGGALAGIQLERARQAQRARSKSEVNRQDMAAQRERNVRSAQQQQKQQDVSMNLSDSSSDEDD
jgi:hypothetical protein